MSARRLPADNVSRPPLIQRIKFGAYCAAWAGAFGAVLPTGWFLTIGHSSAWGFVVAFLLAVWGATGGGVIGLIAGAIWPNRFGLIATFAVLGIVHVILGLSLLMNGHEFAVFALFAGAIYFVLATIFWRRSEKLTQPNLPVS